MRETFTEGAYEKIRYLEQEWHPRNKQVESSVHSSDDLQAQHHPDAHDDLDASNVSDMKVKRICLRWDILSRSEKWLIKELLKLMAHLGVANQNHRKILVRMVSY